MVHPSRFSLLGLVLLLASLTSIPIGMWIARHTSGDFQPIAAAAFHALWGGTLCLIGTALSVAGFFRSPRTALSWTSFILAITLLAGFTWIVCALLF